MTAHASLPLQPASEDIWDKKYRLKDKKGVPVDRDVDATFERVARALSDIEASPTLKDFWFKRFLWALQKGAIPAGRITSNAGAQEHKPATSLINCLAGDTPVITDGGVRPIASLVGAPVRVLNAHGQWSTVEFRSFGIQKTHALRFRHGARRSENSRVIRATAAHRWILGNGKVITTEYWMTGSTNSRHVLLPHVSAPRPDRDAGYAKGVFHGLMFGDGHKATGDNDRYVMDLVEAKRSLAPWVENELGKPGLETAYNKEGSKGLRWNFHSDTPWKQLPSATLSSNPSYVLGFFAGLLATDGNVARAAGRSNSTYVSVFGSEALVRYLERWLPTVGVVPQQADKHLAKGSVNNFGERRQDVWRLAIHPNSIDAVDVLRPEHQAKFHVTKHGQHLLTKWSFEGVVKGEVREEEVFCCEEPTTQSFALDVGLLTGNCTVSDSIKDNMDDIMRKAHEAALTLKAGCVAKGTFVQTERGLVTVERAIEERHASILAYSRDENRFVWRKILKHMHVSVPRQTNIRLHSENGYLTTSIQHPVLVMRDSKAIYVRADEVRLSDLLVHATEARGQTADSSPEFHPVSEIEYGVDVPEEFYDFEVEHDNNYVAGNGCQMVIHNCGIGYAFSTLRPKGAYVAGAGSYTSGPLSFMDIYDKTCFTVASAGGRRGAQMGTFDVSHPDVRDFIRAKRENGRLRQFNLSLLITDEFMKAVETDGDWPLVFPVHPKETGDVDLNDPNQVVWREWEIKDKYIVREDGLVACKVYKTIKAKHLWDAIMASTYDYAEPGFILIDRVNEMNNNWWCENIRATNPCVVGDTRILTREGEVAIQDVAGKQIEVWNGFEWSAVTPRVTGVNQPVIKVSFNNGASLTCTLYHGFFRGDGQKIEAHQLQVGDALLPFRLPGDAEHRQVSVVNIDAVPGAASEVFCFTEIKRHAGVFNGILTANCGEQPLGPYGSCLLGSVNLTSFVRDPFTDKARFDWDEYREVVRVFTRMLDNVVEINGLPLPQQQHEITHKRRHGMGFLGLGSTLTLLRLPYGSPESVKFTEEVSREMAMVGWQEALDLSKEKGPAPIMREMFEVTSEMLRKRPEMAQDGYKVGDKVKGSVLHAKYSRYMQKIAQENPELVAALAEHGARFTHHSSIAPTGTISLSLANNASNGIEPSFAHHYSRNVIREGRKAKEKVEVYSYELLAYRAWVNPDAMPFSDNPAQKLPDYFIAADQVTPTQHVDIQAASQKWIDSSISKTANVPTDFPYEKFKDIYLYAYHQGLKGCTTFRFNPAAFQGVLVKEEDLANTTYRFTLEDGSVVELKGNEEVAYEGETNSAANLFDAIKEGYYGKF